MENAIRIAIPNLESEQQIHGAGLGILTCFAEDLFGYIDQALKKSDGEDWLQKLKISQVGLRNVNFRDPSLLLKILTEPHYPEVRSQLRKPLNSVMPKNSHKDFYDLLSRLLEERNLWFHHEFDATRTELESLVTDVMRISYRLGGLSVNREAQSLLDIFSPPVVPDTQIPSSRKPEKVSEDGGGTSPQPGEPEISSPVIEDFLGHSYTLHTSGEIRDRKTDQLLTDIRGKVSNSLGILLLARKPNGGRLKITNNGVLAAYFGDYWGYVGKVKPEEWFEGHLQS